MTRRWVHRVVTMGVVALVLSGAPLGTSRTLGQDPSSAALPAGSFLTSLSDFAVPEDARIVRGRGRGRPGHAHHVRADVDPDAIATRAATLVAGSDADLLEPRSARGASGIRTARARSNSCATPSGMTHTTAYCGAHTAPSSLGRATTWIRALLLRGLLERMMVPTRIAVGTLDGPAASALLARSFQAPTRPLADVPIDPLELGDLSALAARARRDYAVVRQALGDHDSAMDGSANAAAAAGCQSSMSGSRCASAQSGSTSTRACRQPARADAHDRLGCALRGARRVA